VRGRRSRSRCKKRPKTPRKLRRSEANTDPRPSQVCSVYMKAREKMLAEGELPCAKPLLCRKDDPGKSYSANRLQVIKRRVEDIAGIRFELRALRRTYGQMLLDKGLSIESTSIAMGHHSTKTTETYYCRKDADTVRAEVIRVFDRQLLACPSAKKPPDFRKKSAYWLLLGVGAEGFEPPSTGFHHVESDSTCFEFWVIAPVNHHLSANPTSIIPITGAR